MNATACHGIFEFREDDAVGAVMTAEQFIEFQEYLELTSSQSVGVLIRYSEGRLVVYEVSGSPQHGSLLAAVIETVAFYNFRVSGQLGDPLLAALQQQRLRGRSSTSIAPMTPETRRV